MAEPLSKTLAKFGVVVTDEQVLALKRDNLNAYDLVLLLAVLLTGGSLDDGSGGSVNVPALPVNDVSKRTPHFVGVAASSSGTIPSTATSWSLVLLEGTGSIGGVAIPPLMVGKPMAGSGLNAALAYTTGSSSSAFIEYETAT